MFLFFYFIFFFKIFFIYFSTPPRLSNLCEKRYGVLTKYLSLKLDLKAKFSIPIALASREVVQIMYVKF